MIDGAYCWRMTKSKLVLLVAVVGCGGDDVETIDAWQGEDFHVRIAGTVDGTAVDLELDSASAADLARAFCKREYVVPDPNDPATWSQGTMPSVEATFRIVDGGLEKEYELGFTAADFNDVTAGSALTVVPPVEEQAPAAGQSYLELEWSWETADGMFVNYEGSATSGTIAVELLDGTRGADGVVIPDTTGRLGIFFDTAWPMGGSLAGSLTVKCGPNEVE